MTDPKYMHPGQCLAVIAAFAAFFLALVNLNGPEILGALVIVITLLERFTP